MVPQWPLAVGLYISPQVRSSEFSREAARVEVGSALASTFQWAVSQLFATVVVLDSQPNAKNIPGGLVGAIELTDVDLHEGDAPIGYDIKFYSAKGNSTDTYSLIGTSSLWDGQRSSVSATFQTIGTALSYGIRNQTAKLLVELPKQNSVKHWLEDAGIRQTPLRPFRFRSPSNTQTGGERVMILPDLSSWRYTDNVKAMDCVGNRLRAYHPPVDVVVMDNVIRLEFFPWLEPSTGPSSIEDLRAWLSEPAVGEKIRELRIRYLMTFEGGTEMAIPGGGILCGGGGPGAGCFGFAWGTRNSSFSATILDLHGRTLPKEVVSTQSSGVYVPSFVVPIPFLAPTESVACERLAHDLYEVITKRR